MDQKTIVTEDTLFSTIHKTRAKNKHRIDKLHERDVYLEKLGLSNDKTYKITLKQNPPQFQCYRSKNSHISKDFDDLAEITQVKRGAKNVTISYTNLKEKKYALTVNNVRIRVDDCDTGYRVYLTVNVINTDDHPVMYDNDKWETTIPFSFIDTIEEVLPSGGYNKIHNHCKHRTRKHRKQRKQRKTRRH